MYGRAIPITVSTVDGSEYWADPTPVGFCPPVLIDHIRALCQNDTAMIGIVDPERAKANLAGTRWPARDTVACFRFGYGCTLASVMSLGV